MNALPEPLPTGDPDHPELDPGVRPAIRLGVATVLVPAGLYFAGVFATWAWGGAPRGWFGPDGAAAMFTVVLVTLGVIGTGLGVAAFIAGRAAYRRVRGSGGRLRGHGPAAAAMGLAVCGPAWGALALAAWWSETPQLRASMKGRPDAGVVALLRDRAPVVRRSAALDCAARGLTGALPALVEVSLRDPDPLVRAAALRSAAGLAPREPAVRAALLSGVADDDAGVRAAAYDGLRRLDPRRPVEYRALIAALRDPDLGNRSAVASELWGETDPEEFRWLLARHDDGAAADEVALLDGVAATVARQRPVTPELLEVLAALLREPGPRRAAAARRLLEAVATRDPRAGVVLRRADAR